MRVVCPKCREGDSLVGYDIVAVNAEIDDWIIGSDGLPEPCWSGHSDVLFDTQEPVHPDKPYWCMTCDMDLAAKDLVILPDEYEEEIQ